ncbi:MAG TPA: DUF362 domain-containing protein [bacterium]|nr:DUF362 domain-containing protein [bacterium]HPP86391.1 DUF362 domain-containing protein [bacterium]
MFKVALIRQNNYLDCYNTLKRGFDALGGLEKFIKYGERILIKPNLLMSVKSNCPAVTHPEIIKALLLIIKDFGAIPLIGDSPGRGTVEKVLNNMNLLDFLKTENIRIVDCTTPITKKINFNNREIKHTFFKGVNNADKIWTIAKLKTHGQMFYTGAIKNLFGLVPGALKPELHFKYPDNWKFADMIVDIFQLAQPAFAIIDAIIAMEGNGPGSGEPKNLNCLIMSENALAADMCAIKMINYKTEDIPIIDLAIKRKILGPQNYNEITILGEPLENFIDLNFKKVRQESKITTFFGAPIIGKILKPLILSKPIINFDKCIKCNHCNEICHPKAIKLNNQTNKMKIDYLKCIRCYCCQEICPVGAIKIYKPPLLKSIDELIKKL